MKTTAEAAKVLGITPASLRLAYWRGRIKAAQPSPMGPLFFEEEEVERYAREAKRGRPPKDGPVP